MLEHAIYGVISPEGAASILWRDSARAQDAATSMKITAQDLLRLGVIDSIIPEPAGGAHRDLDGTVQAAGAAIEGALAELGNMDAEALRNHRAEKFLEMGRRLP
jgi:acetyl-CoA carboxylase carboxyl transferase subunit alpha